MRKYTAVVRLTGELDIEAYNQLIAIRKIEEGWDVIKAIKDGLFEIEVEDIWENENKVANEAARIMRDNPELKHYQAIYRAKEVLKDER